MKISDKVVFNGVEYKKTGLYYRCPNKCGNKDYPAPKWKTAKGFLGHLECCFANIERNKQQAIHTENFKKEQENIKTRYFEKLKTIEPAYNIGQEIYVLRSNITKPEYVFTGTRSMRKRYFDYITYYSQTEKIREIKPFIPSYLDENTINNASSSSLLYNGLHVSKIFTSIELAKQEARKQQQLMDEKEKNPYN